jgi:hypothetical protein
MPIAKVNIKTNPKWLHSLRSSFMEEKQIFQN